MTMRGRAVYKAIILSCIYWVISPKYCFRNGCLCWPYLRTYKGDHD